MARTNHCSLFAILLKSMAAIFRCFGISYAADRDRRHLELPFSDSSSSTPTKPVVSRNRELSLSFSPEEREYGVDIDVSLGFDDLELKDEAKFLKACGTLQETPEEIRILSKKLDDSAEKDSEPKYHSWLPISTAELLENELSGQLPVVRFDEDFMTEPGEMDSPTPCSHTISADSEVHISISSLEDAAADITITKVNGTPEAANMSISPGPVACKSEFLNRSVRFARQSLSTESSPQTCIQNREKPELKDIGSLLVSHSPYPTPLNLTDDMQTPGTVFASGNNARVRSQYVYTSVNASEIIGHLSISQGVPLCPPHNANHNSEMSLIRSSIRGELTLSPWLRPAALDGTGNGRKLNPGGNQGARPIIGLVAEHWKEEEDVSPISPKEWDGNGIPNTTTKYKEDQKVRWHATPFVERLEKALSEESFITQREIDFEEEERRKRRKESANMMRVLPDHGELIDKL